MAHPFAQCLIDPISGAKGAFLPARPVTEIVNSQIELPLWIDAFESLVGLRSLLKGLSGPAANAIRHVLPSNTECGVKHNMLPIVVRVQLLAALKGQVEALLQVIIAKLQCGVTAIVGRSQHPGITL